MGEYNQCQTQLINLYELNPNQKNEEEFVAYRLLYKLHNGASPQRDLLNEIQELNEEQKKNQFISHAIQICRAFYSNNFFRFFKLYLETPNMGKYILDFHIKDVRCTFLKILAKSYPTGPLDLQWVSDILAFESVDQFCSFFKNCSLKLINESDKLLLDIRHSKF